MNKKFEEIRSFILTNWDSPEVINIKYQTIIDELNKIYCESANVECLWLISELLIHKANISLQEAIAYTTEALSHQGNIDELHENFIIASNGYISDFKNRNHHKLIDYYLIFCQLYPQCYIARITLIENLLSDFRVKEAETLITQAINDFPEKKTMLSIYQGEFLYRSGTARKAKQTWTEIAKNHPDDKEINYGLAEAYAKFGMFDKAARHYKISFALESMPRKIDALISLIHIYEIKKNYRQALRYNNKIIEVFKKDYGITTGLEIQTYSNNKVKYRELIVGKN